MAIMMTCGHTAQGVRVLADGSRQEACVICGCSEPAAEVPNLEGRTARCAYNCGSERPSSLTLAFFEHKPNEDKDRYYCGCYGWD